MDLDLLESLTDQRHALGLFPDELSTRGADGEILQEILEVDEDLRDLLARRIRQKERALYELSRPVVGKAVTEYAHGGH